MHEAIEEILISEQALQERIRELGEQIAGDYAERNLLLVGILKGAVMFMADLMRALPIPLEMDFMAISSYGTSTESSGVVRLLKDLDEPIQGKDVLIVEDLIDSGLTLQYLNENLQRRSPASLRVCTLLDKEKTRIKALVPHYVGFRIPERFVVGYGLDYAQHYRNLPYIGVLKPEIYVEPPS